MVLITADGKTWGGTAQYKQIPSLSAHLPEKSCNL